jgi:hypothetical protein
MSEGEMAESLVSQLRWIDASDGNRRDNSPNAAGKINSGGPVGARGKISCLDQPLKIPG